MRLHHQCKTPRQPPHCSVRHGLSLLELVVVLGVLAILAGIAVRSLEPVADQARFETTRQQLAGVRLALAGDNNLRDSEGRLLPTGLLTDCGFIPADSDAFFVIPVGVNSWSVQSFDSDNDGTNDLSLSSGWNGPYLQLPIGQTSTTDLLDGWGQELTYASAGGDVQIGSLGSDRAVGGAGYAEDFVADIDSTDYLGSIACRLYDIDGTTLARIDPAVSGNEKLLVRFYGVNAAGGTTGQVELVDRVVASSGTFETRFSDLLHGASAVRALVWDDANSDDAFDASETVVRRSSVHYVTVLASLDQRIDLELR